MVVIPSGSFRMGDIGGKGYREERRMRAVIITEPLTTGKHEVTFDEYDRFARATGGVRPEVGWGENGRNRCQLEAAAYAEWLSEGAGIE